MSPLRLQDKHRRRGGPSDRRLFSCGSGDLVSAGVGSPEAAVLGLCTPSSWAPLRTPACLSPSAVLICPVLRAQQRLSEQQWVKDCVAQGCRDGMRARAGDGSLETSVPNTNPRALVLGSASPLSHTGRPVLCVSVPRQPARRPWSRLHLTLTLSAEPGILLGQVPEQQSSSRRHGVMDGEVTQVLQEGSSAVNLVGRGDRRLSDADSRTRTETPGATGEGGGLRKGGSRDLCWELHSGLLAECVPGLHATALHAGEAVFPSCVLRFSPSVIYRLHLCLKPRCC